eukprot:214772-Rhodomonas_salina.1
MSLWNLEGKYLVASRVCFARANEQADFDGMRAGELGGGEGAVGGVAHNGGGESARGRRGALDQSLPRSLHPGLGPVKTWN